MSRLLLVKHAAPRIVEHLPSSQWTLSDVGERQCETLCSRLVDYCPGAIFTSDEPKAVRTAAALGSRLEIPVSPLAGLHENDRTGMPFLDDASALDGQMEEFFRRSNDRIIGNETADEAHQRFAGAVRQALASTAGETTIVVAHGTVISLLVGRANRVSAHSLWRDLDFTSFVVVNARSFKVEEIVHPTRG